MPVGVVVEAWCDVYDILGLLVQVCLKSSKVPELVECLKFEKVVDLL